MRFTLLFSTCFSLAVYAATTVPVVSKDLYIVNSPISPDGFQRESVLAGFSLSNVTFPAPLIAGYKNKKLEFKVNVQNALTEEAMLTGTSIHWHGILQKGTAEADGAAFVTQCPISSGHSFLYDFPVPEQAGTYWYHSHLALQYCDGLRGPLIIYDDDDPHQDLYDVDDESTIISLTEWFHDFAGSILSNVIVAGHQIPIADSILINGKGRWPTDPTAELAVLNVVSGNRYRFRLISMACGSNFIFSIDSHRLTVIESDGISVEPYTVDSIQIYAAQRYSFVLEANQTVDNYWIRAQPNIAVSTTFENGLNSAILRYQDAPLKEPPTRDATGGVALAETDLHPLTDPAAPGPPTPRAADVVLDLALSVDLQTVLFAINGKTFVPPTVPVLLQILSGQQQAQGLLPDGTISLPPNKVIEITFIGHNFPVPHPFHLHGHTFSVVQSSGSEFNFQNPVRRDTTVVLPGQNATIRFVTDNPGPWFLHCHVTFHQELGLGVVLAEDIPDIASANPVPAQWNDLCPATS